MIEIVIEKRYGGIGIMARTGKSIYWGLWVLRIGLGAFLLFWALDKIIDPLTAVKIFNDFYYISITPSIAMILGSLELSLSLMYIFGMYKTFSYSVGLIIQLISVGAYFPLLIEPFGQNHYFFAEIPLAFSFATLFIIRRFDTLWTLGKKNSIFARD